MSAVLTPPETVTATPPPRKHSPSFVTPLVDLADGIVLHRFTYDEYHAMGLPEIFSDDDRVELLDGLIVDKMPKGRSHIYSLQVLQKLIEAWLSNGWTLQAQDPVKAGLSAPEPDLAIIRGVMPSLKGHPEPPDVPLIVEVSDSTYRTDSQSKLRIYAAAGFPIYWIVNLPGDCLVVHHHPEPGSSPPAYGEHRIYQRGESFDFVLDGRTLTLAVADILPPPESAA